MWDLIVSVPVHCLSFYFVGERPEESDCANYVIFMCQRMKDIFCLNVQPIIHVSYDNTSTLI